MHRGTITKRGDAHRKLDTSRNFNKYSRASNLKKLLVVIHLIFARVKESEGSGVRPEVTLLEVLGQPLVPTDAASPECLRDSAIYLTALGNYTPWALQMYDSSAKIPSGVITGNIKQLGNYDECLRVTNSFGFTGQACTASVRFDVHSKPVSSNEIDMKDLLSGVALASGLTDWMHGTTVAYDWTWCVPSTCTYAEVREKIDISLDPLRVDGRVDMDVVMTKDSCHTAETDVRRLDVADWAFISLLIIFAGVAIVSTSIDLAMQKKYQEKRKDTRAMVLTSFSLYTNGKALLNTKRRSDSIGCLDGLRFISICWIIYGHTHYLHVVGVQLDITRVRVMHEDWSTLLVLNGNIVTDTFFLLSGLLLAYTKYSQKQRNPVSTLNLFELYIRRYLRLTPAYAIVIAFYATIYYKLGTGPEWDYWISSNRDFCRANWWTNLLYVNNIVNVGTMCMSQSWYLAVDMQLLWISPIFLYPMLKFTRAAVVWVILGTGFVISIAIPFVITYVMELTGTMIYYRESTAMADVYLKIYTKTWARAAPYVVGLSMGYLLCRTKNISIKIPKVYTIIGWILAAGLICAAVFGARGMYYEDHAYNRLEASFYAGFHRTSFALGVAWIIFACVAGVAGPVDALLSWTGWIPLSKITYSAYLCHYIVLQYNIAIVRTPGYLTPYTVVHAFLGNLVLVIGLAVFVTLLFEMPFMALDSVVRRCRGRNCDSKSSTPALAKSDTGTEVYRPIGDSVSTMSQIYADVMNVGGVKEGAYIRNPDPSSSYYISHIDNSTRNEDIYTYIVGSQLGSPRPEIRRQFESSSEVLNPAESTCYGSTSTGMDNRGYQV